MTCIYEDLGVFYWVDLPHNTTFPGGNGQRGLQDLAQWHAQYVPVEMKKIS